MEKLTGNNMATEEQFMQVQAYSALSLGLILLFEATYEWIKEYVHFTIVALVFITVLVNWLRLSIKSSNISQRLPKGERARLFWLGCYNDEYLKFVEQKTVYSALLTVVFYLATFWVIDIFGFSTEWVANALVVDHVMPVLGLALIAGAVTSLYYLKVADNE